MPSREMVTHLARVLDLNLRDENQLLLAAGFAPSYGERHFEELGEVGDAVEQLLAAHEPNMAIVVDRHWNLVQANRAAFQFTTKIYQEPPLFDGRVNIMFLMFHPEGLRLRVQNFPEVGAVLLERLRRDLSRAPDDQQLGKLLHRMESMASGLLPRLPSAVPQSLVTTIDFEVDGIEISLFSVLTSIEAANDVTVAELRLETFLPANKRSRTQWNEHFGSPQSELDNRDS